jgi:uncharacterized protein YcbX
MSDQIGEVAGLWRYPVKSMQGERLEATAVTATGVVGDRAYAVVDSETGRVASAKHPRKWSRLLACEATFVEPPTAGAAVPAVRITMPDGSVLRSDEPGVDDALSTFLGRAVTLTSAALEASTLEEVWPDIEGLAPAEFIEQTGVAVEESGETVSDIAMGLAAPKGTFYDLAVLHLLTTGTLNRLRELADGDFDVNRYRPNILIETIADGFIESDWPGRTLEVGGELRADVSLPTMRCIMTTLAQRDLARDVDLLKAIARHNRVEISGLGSWACAGVYAGVNNAGSVRVGEPVVLA